MAGGLPAIFGGSRLNAFPSMVPGVAPQAPATTPATQPPGGLPFMSSGFPFPGASGLPGIFGTPAPATPEKPSVPQPEALQPMVARLDPSVLTTMIMPPLSLDTFVPRFAGPQTMTKLAQSAIGTLNQTNKDHLMAAINSIVNKGIAPKDLMDSLEQGTKITEVISELANGWSLATKDNFVKYFGLPSPQLEVMDAIVSLAALNDPVLEGQLRRENTPQPTPEELLDGRRVLYQYPPPGSVLEPPYVILLAVEHVDTQAAQNVLNAIMMELADYRIREHTFKITRAALQKLQ